LQTELLYSQFICLLSMQDWTPYEYNTTISMTGAHPFWTAYTYTHSFNCHLARN